MYSTNGKGEWWKREWQEQCPQSVFLHGQCQGVKGHKGVHWAFTSSGSFTWSDNKRDPLKGEMKGCSGTTPPDHKDYKTPLQMQKHHHNSFYTDSKVADPKEIARLEREDLKVHESLNRPVSEAEISRLGLHRRLARIRRKR